MRTQNIIATFIVSRSLFDLDHRPTYQVDNGIHDRIWVISKLLRCDYAIPESLQVVDRVVSTLIVTC